MITLKNFITSQNKYPNLWTSDAWSEFKKDANKTIATASELLSRIGIDKVIVSSGFRTAEINKAVGGSKNSKHLYCQAIDLYDPDLKIGKAIVDQVELLAELGLYMESLTTTHKNPPHSWVHLQIVGPKSGNRIFIP